MITAAAEGGASDVSGYIIATIGALALVLVAVIGARKDRSAAQTTGGSTMMTQLLARVSELEDRQDELAQVNSAQWYYITVLQHWGSTSTETPPRMVPEPPPLLLGGQRGR